VLLTSSQEDIVLIGHYGLKLIRYEKIQKTYANGSRLC